MYYQDLEVWKKAIELVKSVYLLTSDFPQSEQFGLVSQLRRASVSIPSNIAEGMARYSNKDKSRFLDIAFGSIAEVETQLVISKELKFVGDINETEELCKQVKALILGIKKHVDKNEYE